MGSLLADLYACPVNKLRFFFGQASLSFFKVFLDHLVKP